MTILSLHMVYLFTVTLLLRLVTTSALLPKLIYSFKKCAATTFNLHPFILTTTLLKNWFLSIINYAKHLLSTSRDICFCKCIYKFI